MVLVVGLSVVAPLPLTQSTAAARGRFVAFMTQSLPRLATLPQKISSARAPQSTEIQRIRIFLGETRSVPFAVSISSFVIVSPEIASAVLNARKLTVTGLHIGETLLLVFDGPQRHTFLIEVAGRTMATTKQNTLQTGTAALEQRGLSGLNGSYAVTYSSPIGGGPGLLRQTLDWQRKLSQGRTLRFSSDMFKFLGQGDQDQARATAPSLGLNRLSLGIDGPTGTLDILDSQINISPLSFNGYTMRGLHVVSAPDSRLSGIEFFAGFARPSLSLFDDNQGRVIGLVVPVAQRESWHVRAAFIKVSPQAGNKLGSGGMVAQINGRYAPSKNIAAEGELAYANGGLSWRARLDLQRSNVNASAEIIRFDGRSPLITIGAQSGGRKTETFAFQWQVTARLNASVNYNHTAVAPPAAARRIALDRTTLATSLNFRMNQNSRLGFRLVQQQIETGLPAVSSRFRLETRTATISYNLRFNKSWSNHFEARLNSSRESRADTGTESGLSFREQLRFSYMGGSATGFVNYTRQNQSVAGLIVRNPGLLPPLLQRAFAADPALFLEKNRDSLDLLLPGVELPQARGLEAGVRLQKAFTRVDFTGDVRYSSSQVLERQQRNLVASMNLNLRLDAANSLQVSGSRSFAFNAPAGQTAFTVSYVHRFGAGLGGGLQFSRLLGLERGVIEGRVFNDLNGNGNDDPDEPGVAGMRVQIDGDRSATSNDLGRYRFQMNSGEYSVAFISEELGVRWRASTATEQRVSLSARQTVNVSFGVNNYGSVGGRVFNDLSGEKTAGTFPGVAGVRVSLSPINAAGSPRTVAADGSGAYRFAYLAPGSYTLEIDRATLPADFQVPLQTSWVVNVAPLENFYMDLPLSAQRSISGVVFIDKDGDGKFDPDYDQPVEGARVIAGKTEVTSVKGGIYLLRNMPHGRIELRAFAPLGAESVISIIELGEGPSRQRGIHLALKH
jgi:SdrD B-like protein/putative type II/III system pilus formation protein